MLAKSRASSASDAGPTGLTKRGLKTRRSLLRAAEETFGGTGYDRSSIADITRLAGVAQGTFYIYFPDKAAILIELVSELSSTLRERIRGAIGQASDRFEIERAGFRAFFGFVREHRNLYRVVRQAEFVDEAVFRSYYDDLARGYQRGLQGAIDAGQIRPCDTEKVAYALMGIADFLGMRWILWEQDCDIDGLVDEAISLIATGLRQPVE